MHSAFKEIASSLGMDDPNQPPSRNFAVPYLQVKCKDGRDISGCHHPGKWCLFLHPSAVDGVWAKVAEATEKGQLGVLSKVYTAKSRDNTRNDRFALYVYTQSYNDVEDVMRVRKALTALGIKFRITYKKAGDGNGKNPKLYTAAGDGHIVEAKNASR